jgi:hypothetical protein
VALGTLDGVEAIILHADSLIGSITAMKLAYVALAGLIVPSMAAAQRGDDRTQFDARMNTLQRSLAELSAQIEQLKARDHQLQQQLENIRTSYDQLLERLNWHGQEGHRHPNRADRDPTADHLGSGGRHRFPGRLALSSALASTARHLTVVEAEPPLLKQSTDSPIAE